MILLLIIIAGAALVWFATRKQPEVDLSDPSVEQVISDAVESIIPTPPHEKSSPYTSVDEIAAEFNDPEKAREIIDELWKMEKLSNSDRAFSIEAFHKREERLQRKFLKASLVWQGKPQSTEEDFSALQQAVTKLFTDWFMSQPG
jgi:hypothetical protein